MPLVVKSDQRRVPFDEAKLRSGMEKALEKRPVSREAIDDAVTPHLPQAAQHGRTRSAVARRSASW